ncbi:hypothetical protein BUALT_Bualt02G0084600 [Buddleja alternifolia]|uniref:Uncharacterized protein n=1 Tax=Buddleja alternifolia TaxID=168488 RepID=A0AAV6Y0P4_9LAMI|nr:hypothetical protein BUALT_Bualt02G0084600 [Buddleja alternifolia]
MGNVTALCVPSITSSGVVKVLSSDGRLMIYTRAPIKAAEIMLENPGKFVCESIHLKVGQRIPGICAEEELERGQLYFLLPMEMLYSVLTNEEMKCLTQKSSKGIKQLVHFSKIFPEFCLFQNSTTSEANKSVLEDSELISSHSFQRLSRQRSWQPALETIIETPPHT